MNAQNYRKRFFVEKKIIKNWLYWNEKLKPKDLNEYWEEHDSQKWEIKKMIDKEENISLFERRFIGADDEYVPISVRSWYKPAFDQYLMKPTDYRYFTGNKK